MTRHQRRRAVRANHAHTRELSAFDRERVYTTLALEAVEAAERPQQRVGSAHHRWIHGAPSDAVAIYAMHSGEGCRHLLGYVRLSQVSSVLTALESGTISCGLDVDAVRDAYRMQHEGGPCALGAPIGSVYFWGDVNAT
jgi:hypothetical protein